MKLVLRTSAAAIALLISTPALADIIQVPASTDQGTLVHGTVDEQTGEQVTGQLGIGGTGVNFNGTTTQNPGDDLRLQGGAGQADVTGVEITAGGNPNDTYLITSMNIFLQALAPFKYIELALYGTGSGLFTITEPGGATNPFAYTLGAGENKFAFNAINGQSIENLNFTWDGTAGTGITNIKQVRISTTPVVPAVPEPSTWAMMLVGFGAIGLFMRRRRARPGPSRVEYDFRTSMQQLV